MPTWDEIKSTNVYASAPPEQQQRMEAAYHRDDPEYTPASKVAEAPNNADTTPQSVLPMSQQVAQAPIAPVQDPDAPDFVPGVKRGLQNMQASFYGAGALAGKGLQALGMEDTGKAVWDAGVEGYKRNLQEAAQYPKKHSFKDVYTGNTGVGGAIDWAQGTLGELVPSMVEAATGSLIGAAAGSAIGPEGTIGGGAIGGFAGRTILKKAIDKGVEQAVKKGIGKATESQIRKQVTKQALKKLGGKVGIAGAVMPMESGGMYAGLLEEHGVDAPETAMLFGALSTAMEFAGGNSRLVDTFIDALGKGSTGLAKKTAKELIKQVPEEALQEGGQEVMGILNTVANTDEKFLTAENLETVIESMAAGAIGGGAGAIVSSGLNTQNDTTDSFNAQVNAKFENIRSGGPENISASIKQFDQEIAKNNQLLRSQETIDAIAAESGNEANDIISFVTQQNEFNQAIKDRLQAETVMPEQAAKQASTTDIETAINQQRANAATEQTQATDEVPAAQEVFTQKKQELNKQLVDATKQYYAEKDPAKKNALKETVFTLRAERKRLIDAALTEQKYRQATTTNSADTNLADSELFNSFINTSQTAQDSEDSKGRARKFAQLQQEQNNSSNVLGAVPGQRQSNFSRDAQLEQDMFDTQVSTQVDADLRKHSKDIKPLRLPNGQGFALVEDDALAMMADIQSALADESISNQYQEDLKRLDRQVKELPMPERGFVIVNEPLMNDFADTMQSLQEQENNKVSTKKQSQEPITAPGSAKQKESEARKELTNDVFKNEQPDEGVAETSESEAEVDATVGDLEDYFGDNSVNDKLNDIIDEPPADVSVADEKALRERYDEKLKAMQESGVLTFPDFVHERAIAKNKSIAEIKKFLGVESTTDVAEPPVKYTPKPDESIEEADLNQAKLDQYSKDLKAAYVAGNLEIPQYMMSLDLIARKDIKAIEQLLDALGKVQSKETDPQYARSGSFKAKGKADLERLIKMLGSQMYKGNLAEVTIKEVVQNSFDAVKASLNAKGNKKISEGKINIITDPDSRIIAIKDNGQGMTKKVLLDAFLTVAGTDKSGMAAGDASGGFGMAKAAFLYGNEWIEVVTAKNGRQYSFKGTGSEIISKGVDIKSEKVDKDKHGTTIVIKVPDHVMVNGKEQYIWFPTDLHNISFFKQPLIHDKVEINVRQEGLSDIGIANLTNPKYDTDFWSADNFDPIKVGKHTDLSSYDKPIKVSFDWGDAELYIGKDRYSDTWQVTHNILSAGVYQFKHDFEIERFKKIPYDVILNISPKVAADAPSYPFNIRREGWKDNIKTDVKALNDYVKSLALGLEAQGTVDQFKNIQSLPRVDINDIGTDNVDLSDFFNPTKDTNTNKTPVKLPTPSKVTVKDGQVKGLSTDGKETVLVDTNKGADGKRLDSSLTADKAAPKAKDFLIDVGIDDSQPIFHNNTSTDYFALAKQHGYSAETFFAEFGSILLKVKDIFTDKAIYGYGVLEDPDQSFFFGTSIDKGYHGANLVVPFKAILVNPLAMKGHTLPEITHGMYDTFVHEFAHIPQRNHEQGFSEEVAKLKTKLASDGTDLEIRVALGRLIKKHKNLIELLRDEYERSTTKNVAKSLNDTEQSDALASRRTSDGPETGAQAGDGEWTGAFQTREQQGEGSGVSTGDQTDGRDAQLNLADVEKLFPGQQITQDETGKISIRLKNGKGITFQNIQQADDGMVQLAIDTGQMSKTGKILGITVGSEVLLDENFADDKTLWHENKHVLDNLGMINKADNSALNHEFNKLRKTNKLKFALSIHEDPIQRMVENRANMFAQIMTDREAYRNDSKFKAMIQRVMDFMQQMLALGQQTTSGLAREVESGKLYERLAADGQATTDDAQGASDKTGINQFAQDIKTSLSDTKAKITDNLNFVKWFGNSKVVDEKGAPLVVYHGTDQDIVFFNAASGRQLGSHFGTAEQAADRNDYNAIMNVETEDYQDGMRNYVGMRTMPVYLSISNPYDIVSDLGDWSDMSMLKKYFAEANEGPFSDKEFSKFKSPADVQRGLIEKGYDGIKYQNSFEGTTSSDNGGINNDAYIAFDPTQIKSIYSTGAFDSTNPDIRFSIGERILRMPQVYLDKVREITDTSAFKNWFGASKITSNGQPHILYHGTSDPKFLQDGTVPWVFDTERQPNQVSSPLAGLGIFLGNDTIAAAHADEKGTIHPFFVKVENPYVTTAAELERTVKSYDDAKAMKKRLQELGGYDGIILKDRGHVIAFDPKQLKSVTDNTGTFDETNADVRFQVAEQAADQKVSQAQYDASFAKKNNIVQDVLQTLKIKGHETKLLADKLTGAISTRLDRANPSGLLKNKMRKLDFDTSQKIIEGLHTALPLLEQTKKMAPADKHAWDLARKNADVGKIQQIAQQYNMTDDLNKMRDVLNQLRKDAVKVGLKVGFIDEYWPRIIKDQEGFLQATQEISQRPEFTDALKLKAKAMGITMEELNHDFPDVRADVINGMILGHGNGVTGPGNIQSRKYDTILLELEKYYMNSDAALMQYIYSMNKAIETRKFFGKVPPKIQAHKNAITKSQAELTRITKQAEQFQDNAEVSAVMQDRAAELEDRIILHKEALTKYREQNDYTENIGAYIDELMLNGELHKKDEKAVRGILEARFNEHGTTGVTNTLKNMAYIDVMGNPIAALTQIGDLAWAAYVGKAWTPKGFSHTVKNIINATLNKSKVTKENLGIERIAQEFADGTTLGNAVSEVFKRVGLTKMDSIGKETLINNALMNYQEQVKTPAGMTALEKQIRPIFGMETKQVIKDLATDTTSDNVKLLLYSKLLDFQPAALSEMPEMYLRGGNGRVFYMLKTYSLKQMDVFRNEVFHELRSGDPKRIMTGLGNMTKLLAMLTLANAGADELKDFVMGKEVKFSDNVIENFLTIGGVSRYMRMKTSREGIGSAMLQQVLPPMKFVDSFSKDLGEYITTGDVEKGLRSLDSVPVAGKLAYWHYGRGSENKKTISEQDFADAGKQFRKFKKQFEKASDKRLFLHTNKDEFRQMKLHENFQSTLNGNKATINKLKKLKQTPNVVKRIGQLENQRKMFYDRYFTMADRLANVR